MRIRGLWKLPDRRNRLWGKQGLVHQARILEWVACSLLQGIFPTEVSNPGLLHCRRILNQLSHQGSPRILEWIAYPFSSGSSQPRNRTRVSCIAADSYYLSYQGSSKADLKLSIQKTKILAFSSITSWELDGETVTDLIYLGSKITADGDCSYKIKRRLLLERRAMTNLDSIFKSRDKAL